MFISEIYESRQGEGRLTGTPSIFIRTSGCNLRCGFCDTPFASWSPEGTALTIEQIVALLPRTATRHVVITGGEPMIVPSLPELCDRLKGRDYHITIETAGTVDRELVCDLMSISPKLSNSTPDARKHPDWSVRHERMRLQPDVVRSLIRRFDYQLKFVVGALRDAEEALQYIRSVADIPQNRIMMMPEGVTCEALDRVGSWLEPWCRDQGVTFCDRAHIRWYGNRRGT